MGKLTVLKIRNMRGPGRISDGGGLCFEITKSSMKRWLYRYRLDGKQQMYVIGRYPEISLSGARKRHREAQCLVKDGINPARNRAKIKQANREKERAAKQQRSNSFKFIALEWAQQQAGAWSPDHAASVISSLQSNVFDFIGDKQIDQVTPPDILKILRVIEGRGSLEIARKVLQRMNAVFRYAVQTGRATYNPAADMRGVLKSKPVQHMPAVFGGKLGQLLRDITANRKMNVTTKLALQFTVLTACRSGEVRFSDWTEINLEEKIWEIPAERMKMRRAHIVPLSKQAIAVLERAGRLWGTEGLIFPSIRDSRKAMSDNTMSKALRDMGYKGVATPHGFRASFSSMAYEKSGFPGEVIEKALAHEEKNSIKRAYNRAEYLEQRKQLMAWWGNTLHTLEHGAEIISLSRHAL